MIDKTALSWFNDLLDTYGSDPENWPQQASQRASGLLQEEPAARELLLIAERLDMQLDTFVVPQVGSNVRQAIHRAIPFTDHNYLDALWAWIFPPRVNLIWKPVLVTAMPLIIGFFIGTAAPASSNDETMNMQEETIFLAGLENTYEGDLNP